MSSSRLILAVLLLSLASVLPAATADFIIPAAGSGEGALGSQWQSEVTLFNASPKAMNLTLSFHDSTGLVGSFPLTLQPRTTTSIADIVNGSFHLPVAVGAITIDVEDDALAQSLIVTSRTLNVSDRGEFGQDVPAVAPSAALATGYSGIVTGPSNVAGVRFNFGLYAIEDSIIDWKLVRADGSVARELSLDYAAGIQVQYNRGVETLFDAIAQNNDIVQANVRSGSVVLYGSSINNGTGDPSFIPAGITRELGEIEFVGVDVNSDGTVDVFAHDGVLDQALQIPTSRFPVTFRVVATDASGDTLTYELVNPSRDVVLVDQIGTIQWYAGVDVSGTTGGLVVRASDGFHSADLLIPVKFN